MLVFAVVNSSYSLTWDLLFDWNLLKRRAKYPFLRETLGYKPVAWYYVAVVADSILRFSWFLYIFDAAALSLPMRGWIVGFLEITRRWMWNFFRLEVGRYCIPLVKDLY